VTESQYQVVEIRESPCGRLLEAFGLAIDATGQSSEDLQAAFATGEHFGDDDLARIEAALVGLRACLVSCEHTFVRFIDRRS